MTLQHLPFKVEPMQVADISAVKAVEQAAYGPTVPRRNYQRELEHNPLSYYFVLRVEGTITKAEIIGAAGFWLIDKALHITTIAIQPRWKGLGLGSWLLLALLEKGPSLNANLATLEARPSNQIALNLYRQYGFKEVGRRPKYYSNNEDALILTTNSFSSASFQARLTRQRDRLLQRLAQIEIDKIDRIE